LALQQHHCQAGVASLQPQHQVSHHAAAAAATFLAALLQIKEAEDRLEVGVHYQIPYPRMYHAPQFRKRQYMDVPIIK
jgi:hypothetical protein